MLSSAPHHPQPLRSFALPARCDHVAAGESRAISKTPQANQAHQMNTDYQSRRMLRSKAIVWLCALFTASLVSAQNTPKSVETKNDAKPSGDVDSETLVLTPFTVSSQKERGYFAPNTLSGTRINSKVENLGASITVITKQQLNDTAALDINDIFRYESNVEGTFNYTALNGSSPTSDLIAGGGGATSGGPALSTRVRGITNPNTALDNYIHTARIPIDTYNISSIEISRGPNSTLFGLGNPSGTVNTNQSTADAAKAGYQVQFRVDSYGSYRGSFDFNQPLLKDKLAIRVAALSSNNEVPQKPSYDITKRLYGALTYKPFKSTTITLKAEHYREDRRMPNSLTPRDGVTQWLNSGQPTWNPLTAQYTRNGVVSLVIPVGSGATGENSAPTPTTLPGGLFANSTVYTRPTMYIDGGKVQLWQINRLNTVANPNATTTSTNRIITTGTDIMRGIKNGGFLYNTVGVSNKALYDWTSLNSAPMNWNDDKAAIYTAEIVQKIVDNLYFRAGWHLEDSVQYNRTGGNTPTLMVDINQNLVDGQANPYFLRPFIQTIEPSIFRLPEYNDNKQAQLTYDLNFDNKSGFMRWLGHHKILGYYENRRITQGTFRYREAIIDPNHPWLTAGALNYTNGAAIGRPTYNYYVGPAGATGYVSGYTPPRSNTSGNFNLRYANPTTGQWINDPATFGTAEYVSLQTRQEITSRGAVLQSDFFKERVVFTGGIRKDFNRTRNSNGNVIDGNTGLYDSGPLRTWLPWSTAQGTTRTAGIVVKPLPWFGLSYNQANSFLPQPLAVDLAGNVLPNTYGRGHDIGFFVNLFDGKLVLSIKKYKQDNTNDRTSNATLGSRIARVEAGGPEGFFPGNTADNFSLYHFAYTMAQTRLGATASTDQLQAEALRIAQFPDSFIKAINTGAAIRGTADTEASGGELELTYNPMPNWTIKFVGAQTETKNTTIETGFAEYLNQRLDFWKNLKNDANVNWWTSTALSTQTAENFYNASVASPLKIDQALLGKSNPQVKKYTARVISNYIFNSGILKDVGLGGSGGWDDKSVVGFLGADPDSDGIVRSLDVNRAFYDKARYNFDLWISYSMKLFQDKIRAKVQLNAQNVTESGGLRIVGVNPDGTPYNFRIINPRKFVLTTTFEF
jgi:outer membrane receptor protein involved in Fe transport